MARSARAAKVDVRFSNRTGEFLDRGVTVRAGNFARERFYLF